jgi:mannose/fructose-specific phosphotransferase system component IIA
MNEQTLGCLITHGTLACSLKQVCDKLIKPAADIHCFSNQEVTLEEIEAHIKALIEEAKPQQVIIFVDLVGGSCWFSANRLKQEFPHLVIVGGVNVPMLVSFHMNLQRLEWEALIEKILNDAQKGVVRR